MKDTIPTTNTGVELQPANLSDMTNAVEAVQTENGAGSAETGDMPDASRSEISPDSREAGAVVELWRRDAELLRRQYPNFDLSAEMKNKKFRHYLLGGDSVKTAYENIHRAEIMEAYGKNAEKKAAERIAGIIAAGARFPHENALSSSASGRTKSGVSHLSKSERAAIIKRAASGERIVL